MIRFALYRIGQRLFLSVSKTLAYEVYGKNRLSPTLYRLKKPIFVSDDINIKDYLPIRNSTSINSGFNQNIKLCRDRWNSYKMTKSSDDAVILNQAVIACCLYYNQGVGQNYSLKDIARLTGVKNNRAFYKALFVGMKKTLRNKSKAVATAKAITIIRTINNYNIAWNSIIGYSKALDKVYRQDLNLYLGAMRSRSLTLDSGPTARL